MADERGEQKKKKAEEEAEGPSLLSNRRRQSLGRRGRGDDVSHGPTLLPPTSYTWLNE